MTRDHIVMLCVFLIASTVRAFEPPQKPIQVEIVPQDNLRAIGAGGPSGTVTASYTGRITNVSFAGLASEGGLKWRVSGQAKPLAGQVRAPRLEMLYVYKSEIRGVESINQGQASASILKHATPTTTMIVAAELPRSFSGEYRIGSVNTSDPRSVRIIGFVARMRDGNRIVHEVVKNDSAALRKYGVSETWWKNPK